MVLAAVSESGLALEHASCELRSLPMLDVVSDVSPTMPATRCKIFNPQRGSKRMVLQVLVYISVHLRSLHIDLILLSQFSHVFSSFRTPKMGQSAPEAMIATS